MCLAAETTIVQVRSIVPLGELDPESIVTPAIFVNQIVEVSDPVEETQLIREGVIRSPQ